MANYVDGLDTEYTREGGDVPNLGADFVPPETRRALINIITRNTPESDEMGDLSLEQRAQFLVDHLKDANKRIIVQAKRIAELERERDDATRVVESYIKAANDDVETIARLRSEAKTSNKKIGELVMERNRAQRFVNENAELIYYWRDLFKRANAAKRIALYNLSMMGTLADNYRAERDAAQARSGAKSIALEELRAELDAALAAKAQAEVDAAIKNTCPSCGRQSLFIGRGGWLTCSRKDCNPSVQQSVDDLHAELHEMRAARDSAIRRLKEREAEYDLQIRAATIGVELVTKMLETYQAEYVKMVGRFRAANAAKRAMRAFLFCASERAEQAEADARMQSEYIQTHGLTEFEMARLTAERDAAQAAKAQAEADAQDLLKWATGWSIPIIHISRFEMISEKYLEAK